MLLVAAAAVMNVRMLCSILYRYRCLYWKAAVRQLCQNSELVHLWLADFYVELHSVRYYNDRL
jgi:hypothetical protein